MTKRQAVTKAQDLANSEQRSFVVLTSGGRKASVFPVSDLDFAFLASQYCIVVAPQRPGARHSAMETIALEAKR